MKQLSALLGTIPSEPIPVQKVVIWVHWTLVSSKYSDLGSTMVGEGPHGNSPIRNEGFLHKKSAQELAHWILSNNFLEASSGIAAINSPLDMDERRVENINAAEIIARESRFPTGKRGAAHDDLERGMNRWKS